MKYSAVITIKGIHDEDKTECVYTGTVEHRDGNAFIEYSDGDMPVCIGVGTDTLTITRYTLDAYTLFLKQGQTSSFNIGSVNFTTFTSKLKTHITDTAIEALSIYSVGLDDNKIKLIIKAKYSKNNLGEQI